jgi:hypothetical protein
MFTRILLCLAVLTMSSCAFAQNASPAVGFAKAKWVVSGGYCPVGCAAPITDFIKSQVGSEVTLSNDQLSAPFLDKCEGTVHYEYQAMAADQLASELSQGLSANKRFTPENMRIASPKVVTALAFCHSEGSDSTMARIISIEPHRVRILLEGQSIIELH